MNKPIKILGLSGSIRKESYNTLLIMETQKISEDLLGNEMHISIYPLNDIPLYNNDLESDFQFPKEVERFRELIRDSDALLISSPEYNGSVTGVLKNALDWASRKDNHTTRPLEGKAVAIIGAGGGSGTKNSQKHLQSILNHTKSTIIDNTYVGIEHTWKYVNNNHINDSGILEKLTKVAREIYKYCCLLYTSDAADE